jgi:hypothetical protein
MCAAFLTGGTGVAHAGDCDEKWPPEMGPQFSCVTLTNALLVSLEGATLEQAQKTLRAKGGPVGKDGNRLRFLIPVGSLNGYVFLGLKDDHVFYISGKIDRQTGDPWSPTLTPKHFILRQNLYSCSDFPGADNPKGTDCAQLQASDDASMLAKNLSGIPEQ